MDFILHECYTGSIKICRKFSSIYIMYIVYCVFKSILRGGRGVHLDLSVGQSENFYFCDKGGKVGTSVSYGHISSFSRIF